jgi:hypothetical protein
VNDTIQPLKADPSQSPPTVADTRIHWADTAHTARPDLEQQFEAMRARNWITDGMVQQYQKHWHCAREVALERLLTNANK